jgi:hypothetical protein
MGHQAASKALVISGEYEKKKKIMASSDDLPYQG